MRSFRNVLVFLVALASPSAPARVNDASDTTADNDFDTFTVLLHELGHSLGLGHSSDSNAVMFASYSGARRTLSADDIAGIQAIYGAAQSVPEPGTFGLLAVGSLGFLGYSRLRGRRATTCACRP